MRFYNQPHAFYAGVDLHARRQTHPLRARSRRCHRLRTRSAGQLASANHPGVEHRGLQAFGKYGKQCRLRQGKLTRTSPW